MEKLMAIGRRAFAAFALGMLTAAAFNAPATAQSFTVRLVVDFGDGFQKVYPGLPWSKGATVMDIMNAAKAHPHKLDFRNDGSGATAFLTEIDGQKNEGSGTGKKNWLFWVNAAFADRSFGVYELQPSDVVTWRFAVFEGK